MYSYRITLDFGWWDVKSNIISMVWFEIQLTPAFVWVNSTTMDFPVTSFWPLGLAEFSNHSRDLGSPQGGETKDALPQNFWVNKHNKPLVHDMAQVSRRRGAGPRSNGPDPPAKGWQTSKRETKGIDGAFFSFGVVAPDTGKCCLWLWW